ncbi:MAG TPA: hypothetical protein PKN36_08895 [bacterium]|jgi:hypothetical protein|nr:hypothetical protein [bacterium]
MKKLTVILMVLGLLSFGLTYATAGEKGHQTPAPNSGDGVSDGSGYEAPNGPNDMESEDQGQGYDEPAPNSGDGIPDGSGR